MRKISLSIPSDYCNTCVFFRTGMPDPESCTGFGGFRRYFCNLFNTSLSPDYNLIHRKRKDSFESDEHKAHICDKCRNKYK